MKHARGLIVALAASVFGGAIVLASLGMTWRLDNFDATTNPNPMADSVNGNTWVAYGALFVQSNQSALPAGDTIAQAAAPATFADVSSNFTSTATLSGFRIGRSLHVWAYGQLTGVAGGSTTVALISLPGPVVLLTSGAIGQVAATNAWTLDAHVTCSTLGAAGAFSAGGNVTGLGGVTTLTALGNAGTVAVDTTVTHQFGLRVTAMAGAGSTITQQNLAVEPFN